MNNMPTIATMKVPDGREVCSICFYVPICKRTMHEACMAHNRADRRSVYFVELRTAN